MKGKNVLLIFTIAVLGFTLYRLFYLDQKIRTLEAVQGPPTALTDSIPDTDKTGMVAVHDIPVTMSKGAVNPEELTIRLFEEAAPSVTFITTTALQRDFWTRNVYEIPGGTGSGFIWDKKGHIVTNYHVIKDASKAQVTLSDNTSYSAKLIGVAPEKDLAVLKIEAPAELLQPIPVGKSYNLKVGQTVFAIGNPFGLDQTLTTGIISALGREIESQAQIPIRDVIQTDAAINPGNSGGPLLDSSGKLIGVNTAIYSPSGAYAGIGFSIPVDVVKWVVPDLIEFGEVKRPRLGIEMVGSQYMERMDLKGALVLNVVPDSPAEKAGLQATTHNKRGDLITAVNGKKIRENLDLILELEKYKAGDQVSLEIVRAGKKLEVTVILDTQK